MKPISNLARQILGESGAVKFFTQREFDDSLEEGKAQIMAFAISSAKQAVMMEREACAVLADNCTVLADLPAAIRNRIPSQKL